jgi:hypothetical protein
MSKSERWLSGTRVSTFANPYARFTMTFPCRETPTAQPGVSGVAKLNILSTSAVLSCADTGVARSREAMTPNDTGLNMRILSVKRGEIPRQA